MQNKQLVEELKTEERRDEIRLPSRSVVKVRHENFTHEISGMFVDRSQGGARLKLLGNLTALDGFHLYIPATEEILHCHTVWVRNNEIGVQFKTQDFQERSATKEASSEIRGVYPYKLSYFELSVKPEDLVIRFANSPMLSPENLALVRTEQIIDVYEPTLFPYLPVQANNRTRLHILTSHHQEAYSFIPDLCIAKDHGFRVDDITIYEPSVDLNIETVTDQNSVAVKKVFPSSILSSEYFYRYESAAILDD